MDFFFVTYLVVGLLPSRFSFWFIYLNLLFFLEFDGSRLDFSYWVFRLLTSLFYIKYKGRSIICLKFLFGTFFQVARSGVCKPE